MINIIFLKEDNFFKNVFYHSEYLNIISCMIPIIII